MSIHKDHRQRVKNRFMKEGLENFDDVHVLELMLFYCVPRKDTNPIAHNLLNHFGSLSAVIQASAEQLKMVEGVGDSVVAYICFLRELERACHTRKNLDVKVINSYQDIVRSLRDRFLNCRNELVYMICMDAKRRILCIEKLNEGTVNSAGVPTRKVIELALAHNAAAVVLAHNHPGGEATPSQEDIAATQFVRDALRAIDVELTDHVVFADNQYFSIINSGMLEAQDRQEGNCP